MLERNGRLVALVLPDLDAARTSGTGRLAVQLRISFGELGNRLPRYRLPDLFEHAKRRAARLPDAVSEGQQPQAATPRARAVLKWLGSRFPDKPLDLDASLQMDLDIDSLSWVDLSLDLERRLDVSLPESTIAGLVTVRDLITAVERAPTPESGMAREMPSPEAERWIEEPGPLATIAGSILHTLSRIIAHLFLRLEVVGRAELPVAGPCIIVANHVSDLDPIVLAAALPYTVLRRAWWGADARRVFGRWIARLAERPMRLFPIDDHVPGASLERACSVLERGHVLIWFPEEWRSPTGEIHAFQTGIGALVARTGAGVIPVYIQGTFEVMPRAARLPQPHRVSVRIGHTIPQSELTRVAAKGDERTRYRLIAALIHDAVAALGPRQDGDEIVDA